MSLLSSNSLHRKSLSCITNLDLVLRRKNQFVFALRQPGYRVDIVHYILECVVILRDDFRPQCGLHLAQILTIVNFLIKEGLELLSNPYPVEVLIHALFDIPNHQAGIIHR